VAARTVAAAASLVVACALPASAAAGDPDPGRDLQLMVAFSAGTGYGWADEHPDVNADVQSGTSGPDGPGHLTPEIGLLSARSQLFASLALRYQVITATTDVYVGSGTTTRVFHAAHSAAAFLARAGRFFAPPDQVLQPYLSFAVGWGDIRHVVHLPLLRNCGPQQNEECADTLFAGDLFVGPGGGLQLRFGRHVAANVAYEVLLSRWRGTFTVDLNVGLAALF
jgi:hypothetical protein